MDGWMDSWFGYAVLTVALLVVQHACVRVLRRVDVPDPEYGFFKGWVVAVCLVASASFAWGGSWSFVPFSVIPPTVIAYRALLRHLARRDGRASGWRE